MSKYLNEKEILAQTNEQLIDELSSRNIKKLQLSVLGNSISTGFTLSKKNCPLLQRNETLREIAERKGITLETHNLARAENNSDENIYSWLLTNKKEDQYNKEVRRDYREWKSKGYNLLTEEELLDYYPTEVVSKQGTKDIVFRQEADLANIIILNGGTGSFLDNATRKGKHKLTTGIKKDRAYMEALLGLVQLNNRENYANTQIYLCGVPRMVNTPVSDIFINSAIKKAIKQYANVTYVPNFSRAPLYKSENGGFPISLEPHYNEEEYLHLLTQAESQMIKNYQQKNQLIEIDREFNNKSIEMELSRSSLNTRDFVLSTIETYAKPIQEAGKNYQEFLNTTSNYLLERYPYNFYYLDQKAIKEAPKVLARRKA